MNPLSYAPKPPRSRRLVRRAIIFLLLAATLFIAIRLTPITLGKIRFLDSQRQWLNYHAPPNQLVLLVDWRPDFLGLIHNDVQNNTDPNLQVVEWLNYQTPATAGRPLAALDTFLTQSGLPITDRRDLAGNPTQPTPVLYCGQRNSQAGKRLVRIAYRAQSFSGKGEFQGFVLAADIYEPATFFAPLRHIASNKCYVGTHPTKPYSTLLLFAGQSDPNNPARFTIAYQLGNSPGLIEGFLDNDAKSVSIKVQSGPLTSAP